MRSPTITAVCIALAATGAFAADGKKTAPKPKTSTSAQAAAAGATAARAGVKTPGVQIPFASLKAEAQIAVETPGWISFAAGSVLMPNRAKNALLRIDAKTSKAQDPIAGLEQPCGNAISAFGSLWIANCGAKTLARIDMKTAKIAATLAIGAADAMTGLAATADSVWMLVDAKTTLARIDPGDNKVVDELRLPAGCNNLAYDEGSLWVTCPEEARILRINPHTNLVEKRIEVAGGPRALAFGANSLWVLCEKEGKLARIDPHANKVIKTIDLGTLNAAGSLAFGDGFVWITQSGFPLTRVDPQSDQERVAQQFWGEGGGRIGVAPGAIWLANVKQGSLWRIDPKRVLATLAE